jgi:uncharacterized delta-60 repeat protein
LTVPSRHTYPPKAVGTIGGAMRSGLVLVCVVSTLVLTDVPARAAAGSLDARFGAGGKQTTLRQGGTAFGVAIDHRGRIVVAGYTLSSRTDFAVTRFLKGGRPDPDFGGGDGRVTTNLGGTDYGFDVAVAPNGGIVVAGESDGPSRSRAALVRYRPGGGLDRDFGGGDGKVVIGFGKRYSGANAVAIAPNGTIVVGGFTSKGVTGRWALARLTPRGRRDRSFGGDGVVTADLSRAGEQINDIVLATGGVVAAGYAEAGLTPRIAIAKFHLRGALDRGFGHKGVNIVDISKGSDIAYGVSEGPDGSLVVAGYAANGQASDWGVVRFKPNGRLDDTFSGNGYRVIKLGPQYEFAYGVAVQPNGRAVIVGRATRDTTGDDFGVFRLKLNGAFDKGFGNGGRAYANFFSGSDTARDVALQPDGKIVVVGEATRIGVRRLAAARFLA